ncbi:MAG TPA: dockerin type I domain-containing protein, partial [Longimicrobium sp.]
MRRFTLKAVALAGVLLGSALIPALAQQRGPGIVGDVNGDGRITSADALAVYAYLAGRSVPASFDIAGRGDADGDGRITRADADLIMRVAVGQAAPGRPVGKPTTPGATPAEVPTRIRCSADLRSGSIKCGDTTAPGGDVQAEAITYSGQHVNLSLLTDNVVVTADTFAFDLRVKNLIPQAIGTSDGSTVDPVKIFFSNDVQAVGGTVTAVNHDGAQPFTVSEPQKFFQYAEIIQPQATSAAHRWKLRFDPGVTSFYFYLYANSPVRYPRGIVDVYPDSATLSAGATLQLADTVRSALGHPIPGATVTWSSSNTAVATVDGNGIVTAVGD